MADLMFEHVAPRWALGLGLAAAVGATVWALWRHRRAHPSPLAYAGLRLVFLLLLGWCLLRPVEKTVRVDLLKPRFVVMLDTSQSMTLAPREGLPRRLDVARSLLRQPWLERVSAECRLEAYAFAGEVSGPMDVAELRTRPADGPGTRLRDSLLKIAERYRGQKLAGALVLTDGLDTRESGTLWARQSWPCPLYTARLEPLVEWTVAPDVRIESVQTPRRVNVGWSSDLKALVSGEGTGGQWLTVKLVRNGEDVQELPTQITGDGGSREVSFRLEHPQAGFFTYDVFIPPLAGEVNTNDNRFAVNVQVLEAGNTLLYVEGVPRWESKFLNRALQSLSAVSPLSLVRGPDGRLLAFGTANREALELTDANLARFKVVILGNLPASALEEGRAEALRRFVEQGGSLALLGGPEAWGAQGFRATALADLMGVRQVGESAPIEGRYAVALTPEGRTHPVFAGDPLLSAAPLPPVLSVFPTRDLAPGAVTLVEAQTEAGALPVIVSQRYGQGKVLSVLTDSLWRWQLEPSSGPVYLRFWTQMISWLLPAETVAEEVQLDLFSETDRLFLGETLTLNSRLSAGGKTLAGDVPVTCELAMPDGRRLPFAMSRRQVEAVAGGRYARYTLEFKAELPGLYRATASASPDGRKVESPPFSFFVRPYTPELAPRPANVDLLQSLAAASGGRFCETNELSAVLAGLPFESHREERVTYATRWQTLPVLACLLGLLCIEWIARKVANLA